MQIIHLDEHLVAVHKPTGLLVHRSAIDRHETRFALQLVRDHLGQRVYPVHRLDKPTSGVLLFALSAETARCMTDCFARGAVTKTYLAVVRGFTDSEGCIDYPLLEEPDPISDALATPDKPPQSAVTRFRRLATAELPFPVGRYASCRYSLLEVTPATGRKHQIRRHMKHVFHPVIGDTRYGYGRHNRFFRAHLACGRLLLASTALEFEHPRTAQPTVIRAGLAREFHLALSGLGWAEHIDPALRPADETNRQPI